MSVNSNNNNLISSPVSSIENAFNQLALNDKQENFLHTSKNYGKEIYSDSGNGGIWRVKALSQDEVVSASYDHLAKIWTLTPENQILKFKKSETLAAHQKEVLCIAEVDDKTFVTGSSDGSMCFWDRASRKLVNSISEKKIKGFYSIAAVNANTIATGSCHRPKHYQGEWKHTIKIWDISMKKLQAEMEGPEGGISAIVKLNEKVIAASSGDGTVTVWDLAEQRATRIFKEHKGYVYGLAKVGTEKLISGSLDRSMFLLDVETGKKLGTFDANAEGDAHASTVYDVNTLDALAVSGSRDGYVKIWDVKTLKCIKTLDPQCGFIYGVNFFPNGNIVAGTSGKIKYQKWKGKVEKMKPIPNTGHLIAWDFR